MTVVPDQKTTYLQRLEHIGKRLYANIEVANDHRPTPGVK